MILELPCVYPRHLADVPELAASFPDLTIVIDHLGKPPLGGEDMGSVGRAAERRGLARNVAAKLSGLNTALPASDWDADDLREAVEVALGAFGPDRLRVRQRLAGRAAERRLRAGMARDCARDRAVAPQHAAQLLSQTALRLYDLDGAVAPAPRSAVVTALTDQAIAKIKDLIMSGEFTAGSKLPNEQDLSQRLGLSRNSLREAVRALTLIGVLEPRVGDGTYVTSLEPELLLTGHGLRQRPADRARRCSSSIRCAGSWSPSRPRWRRRGSTTTISRRSQRCLAAMDEAETTQAFIAADAEFHGIIVAASGNSTLASLIQNLSGGTLRARIWRSVIDQDAIEVTKRRHWDIYNALRDGDAERARAADLIHLSEGVRWLEQLIEAEEAIGALAETGPKKL